MGIGVVLGFNPSRSFGVARVILSLSRTLPTVPPP